MLAESFEAIILPRLNRTEFAGKMQKNTCSNGEVCVDM